MAELSALPVTTAIDACVTLHNSIKTKYTTFYIGGALVQAVIDQSTLLTTNLTTLRTNTITVINNQLAQPNKLIQVASLSNSLDKQVGTNAAFDKWIDGIGAVSNGTWVASINTDLQYCITNTLDSTTLTTKLTALVAKVGTKISQLATMSTYLDAYPTQMNTLATQLGAISANSAIAPMSAKIDTIRPTLGVANLSVASSRDSFQSAQTALGGSAKVGEVIAYAKNNLIVSSNAVANMTTIKNNMSSQTTVLNT